MTTETLAHRPANADAEASLRRQLEPVRRALLDDAGIEAERIVDDASHRAADIVAAAESECAEQLERVRRRRARSAEADAAQRLTAARREAHESVLRAREASRRRLIAAIHKAADAMREDPRYDALLDHLGALARDQLGTNAAIDRDPHPGGGIVAVSGSRRVDYTLAALADRALDELADEVVQLWK